ncbi:bacillithiol biosynthesis deacetylase BshB2 [Alicyclobacillus cycloheptanicus]|uniref:Bacillithiol biosynthesis deacetylase BshB2 n=1 Tax=Alicyclobacillus cycloheptanicus TaxID=1457 RepID=A0ABT9XJ20_9BACL|nr:bacillithiol biosynthesis deacetylase BshB2 [Alicyclobacillus cycloheptanicus]MDQ0190313.1 bacillithiol biosynthesis deacetylase BshB2 [Alicyclobacillus cycloheptanicus]WDM00042.1 bacillithiol biosynthesis deacetylase BshB2 [Alicyclobacillus cycloheptanicus]
MLPKQRHVLAVFPHPDDETFGKAGTVAMYTKAGTPVTLICGTLGQMGRNMGKPFFATREKLPMIRKKELEDACEILGIKDLRLLGLRDKTVEFEDPEVLADRIGEVIAEVRPSMILTYYPKHGVHPDHDALSAATVRAVARLPEDERPEIWGSAVTKNARAVLGEPDIVIDVREVMDIKLAAMRAHRSQSEAMMKNMEAEAASSEAAKKAIEERLGTEVYWIYRG